MPIPGEDDDPLPTAEEIMRQVRDAFPEEPLLIQAKLERRGAPPSSERSYRVQIVLRWNEAPPNARILLADAFGSPLAETRVWYREDGAEFRVPVGDAPHPDAKIFDTDFTWGDLALSFLWWTGGELLGFESRRGRRCYVVDFPHPDPSRHAHVLRLWIDAHVYALLQAEVRDARGDALRRLSVRSLRRVGLRWTLEDLEMRDLVADTRTRLRVEELYALEESLPEAAP